MVAVLAQAVLTLPGSASWGTIGSSAPLMALRNNPGGEEFVSTLAASESQHAGHETRPRQNWILSSWGDCFFIIGTPVFVLPLVLWLFFIGGELLVWSAFAVVNTSHHLPTFMRIYGDRDLLKRFRWSLLLAPIIPFSCCMLAVLFLISSGRSLNDILYLYIIVTIWDLWHFLMQHYGFMRIYDRHNRAPRKIAARMDLLLCSSWFIYIMLATIAWLPNLLYQLAIECGVPLVNFVNSSFLQGCQWFALIAAVAVTIRYIFYLRWCQQENYFISYAKLALMLVTFGMMYLTYVPHGVMDQVIRGITSLFNALAGGVGSGAGGEGGYARGFQPSGAEWTLLSGFATLGIVHVTQYLAIVWKYNRNLARREESVRSGAFRWFFSRGGWMGLAAIVLLYLVLCFGYGYVVTMGPGNPVQPEVPFKWLIGLLASILFASTITHYYYDGFIWKVRHKENRQNLEMEETAEETSARTASWWDRSGTLSPLKALTWQAIYFLPPILLLSGCYWLSHQRSAKDPIAQLRTVMEEARTEAGEYRVTEPQRKRAGEIIEKIDQQFKVEERMIELYPRRQHVTYQAQLTYWKSAARISLLQRGWDDPAKIQQHLHQVDRAKTLYIKSLGMSGSYANREDLQLNEEVVKQRINDLEREMFSLIARLEQLRGTFPGAGGD